MDEQDAGAVAESPTADVPTADTSAGTQNTGNGQPNVAPPVKEAPFHQHPRFQQLIGENRSLKGELGQLKQALDELKRTASQPARSVEDREQRSAAIKALKELMAEDPELAELMAIRKEFPSIKQGVQGVGEVARAQQDMQLRTARSHIEQLAKDAGLPSDPKFTKYVSQMVALATKDIDGGESRFERGDLSVLDEAFKNIEGFLSQVKRDAATTTLQTKAKTKQLPPVPRGGAPGQDALPKLKPGEERAYREQLHSSASNRLASLLNQG